MIDPDDRPQFAQVIAGTMAIYSKDVTKSLAEMYWNALRSYDISAVANAFGAWLMNPDQGQFYPKPADIVRMIDGSTGDRAMTAWSTIIKSIRMVGPYCSVAFDDPIVHRVIDDMGGWLKLCHLKTEKDLEFAGIDFIKRYRGFALAGGVGSEYPSYLIGESEASNQRSGYKGIDSIKLIGDEAKAVRVARLGSSGSTLRIGEVANKAELLGSDVLKRIKSMSDGS